MIAVSGRLQQIVDLFSGSDDSDITQRANCGLEFLQSVPGEMSVCLLKLIFSENKAQLVRKIVSVYRLQTVRVNREPTGALLVIYICETLLLCYQYLL